MLKLKCEDDNNCYVDNCTDNRNIATKISNNKRVKFVKFKKIMLMTFMFVMLFSVLIYASWDTGATITEKPENAKKYKEKYETLELESGAEMEVKEVAFIEKMLEYARPVFLFIVFISLLGLAFFSLIKNQDAKERENVKEKLKHILIGVLVFSVVGVIIVFTRDFVREIFYDIEIATRTSESEPIIIPDNKKNDTFINLLAGLLDFSYWLLQSLANYLLSCACPYENVRDIANLIMPKLVLEEMTYYPFTAREWNRYMYAYNALYGIMLMLVSIALIKVICEFFVYAGNAEKIEETKKSALRMVVAMFATFLGPYFFRLVLTFFNYLVTLIPIGSDGLDNLFNIHENFEGHGIIGSIAGMSYFWIEIKIYLTFIVRKIMLVFTLLITPIAFGFWAISDKTRGVSIWIGEIVTNAAMQFFYALTFFIIKFILIGETNSFIILMTVTILIRIVNFFRDSLQGLVQKWGGIDEEGMAEQTFGQMKGAVTTFGRTANNIRKGAGGLISGTANLIDPQGVSKGGRIFNNVGAVISINPAGWRTKTDLKRNAKNILRSKEGSLRYNREERKRKVEGAIEALPETERQSYQHTFNQMLAGKKYSEDELKAMESKGSLDKDLALFYKDNEEYTNFAIAASEAEKAENEAWPNKRRREKEAQKRRERIAREEANEQGSGTGTPNPTNTGTNSGDFGSSGNGDQSGTQDSSGDSGGSDNAGKAENKYKGEHVESYQQEKGNKEGKKFIIDAISAVQLYNNNEINLDEKAEMLVSISDAVRNLTMNQEAVEIVQRYIATELAKINTADLTSAELQVACSEIASGVNVPPTANYDAQTHREAMRILEGANKDAQQFLKLYEDMKSGK